ncbi:sulfite exporter TauE/SafE family protein [Lapillicoccus sp.]|uniref:sulfite exporter TauE/SafE family protein n=1 Tax=Lapillicoccus sp. TaxID=1909287 RepID=UPI0025F613DB|nr:sulfite exporter TauE/SafE family protein [Lapillicoccus sp.]
MSWPEMIAVFAAGVFAGGINTIVGSGTLVTFPILLFLGFPALTANVSNNIGLVAGGITGSYGYRKELTGQSATLRRMIPLSFVGSVIGASLLLVLPADAFKAIVPVLIAIALVLVLIGPRLQKRAADRAEGEAAPSWHRWAIAVGVFVAGVYGGYFGAAQGVLLMGILSALSSEPLQRLNGYKNVLSLIVNFVAAVLFILFARDHITWLIVLFIGLGSFLGGIIGAKVGRRIPPNALRALIITIGVVAIVKLIWFS